MLGFFLPSRTLRPFKHSPFLLLTDDYQTTPDWSFFVQTEATIAIFVKKQPNKPKNTWPKPQ